MQSLERIVQVIDLVTSRRDGVSLAELVAETNISKTALHRICGDLWENRLLARDRRGRFHLGSRVLEWSESYRKDDDFIRTARPLLKKLQELTRETVHLFWYDGSAAYYLDKIESDHAVRMDSRIGSTVHLHSTGGGKAILAHLSIEERQAYYSRTGLPSFTPYTLTDTEELDANLAAYLTAGVFEEKGENEADIRCLAVAIVDAETYPIGAISIAVPAYRFPEESKDSWSKALLTAKEELERHTERSEQE